MKKRVFLLLPLFLGACSESGESPVITIEKLYVKTETESAEDTKEDYANRLDELPALKAGDEIETFLLLDGNGSELKSFRMEKDEEVKTELHYKESEVSTEGNLTDEENGQLRFKDGVTKAGVLVQAIVEKVEPNGDVHLSFYLSSKAECEGAQEVIVLKTKLEEEDKE